MSKANIEALNGLGDKIIDIVGFCLICKYMNYIPHIKFNNNVHWGSYDKNLFVFNGFQISDEPCTYFLKQIHPTTSLSPYKIYEFLKPHFPLLKYEVLCKEYNVLIKNMIKPSDIIISRMPKNLDRAYGIHLRKSDKVSDEVISELHMTTIAQHNDMITAMLDDIKKILLTEYNPTFFVCSEDKNWANEIKDRIRNLSKKPVVFLTPDYTNEKNYANLESVLDMFCLSRCRTIFQSVKYTTFSILASLLGNNRLMNYSYVNESDNDCLIHNWVSTIEINNNYKNYDTEYFFCKFLTSPRFDFLTNIKEIQKKKEIKSNMHLLIRSRRC